ncbi:nucleus export BRL1 [Fusarium sp. NRRL 25303]|nr:nucleus export BRL1 [Fusarium sp. NRRL 25303]
MATTGKTDLENANETARIEIMGRITECQTQYSINGCAKIDPPALRVACDEWSKTSRTFLNIRHQDQEQKTSSPCRNMLNHQFNSRHHLSPRLLLYLAILVFFITQVEHQIFRRTSATQSSQWVPERRRPSRIWSRKPFGPSPTHLTSTCIRCRALLDCVTDRIHLILAATDRARHLEAATISRSRQIFSILAHCKLSFILTSISDLLRSQSRIRIEPFHKRLLLPSSYRYLRTTKPRPRLSATERCETLLPKSLPYARPITAWQSIAICVTAIPSPYASSSTTSLSITAKEHHPQKHPPNPASRSTCRHDRHRDSGSSCEPDSSFDYSFERGICSDAVLVATDYWGINITAQDAKVEAIGIRRRDISRCWRLCTAVQENGGALMKEKSLLASNRTRGSSYSFQEDNLYDQQHSPNLTWSRSLMHPDCRGVCRAFGSSLWPLLLSSILCLDFCTYGSVVLGHRIASEQYQPSVFDPRARRAHG